MRRRARQELVSFVEWGRLEKKLHRGNFARVNLHLTFSCNDTESKCLKKEMRDPFRRPAQPNQKRINASTRLSSHKKPPSQPTLSQSSIQPTLPTKPYHNYTLPKPCFQYTYPSASNLASRHPPCTQQPINRSEAIWARREFGARRVTRNGGASGMRGFEWLEVGCGGVKGDGAWLAGWMQVSLMTLIWAAEQSGGLFVVRWGDGSL